MPSTRFHVTDVFVLKSRSALVLVGDVVDGNVQLGDRIVSGADIDASVFGIEMLCPLDKKRRDSVGLHFRYPDELRVAAWLRQPLRGAVLELDRSNGVDSAGSA
jgi:hypothetical protein